MVVDRVCALMLTRKTPLRSKPKSRGAQAPLVCRSCHRSPPAVWFKPLQRRLCSGCSDTPSKPARSVTAKPQRKSVRNNPAHLTWIRNQGCIVRGGCIGGCQAHHVRRANNSGTSIKPSDDHALGLCLGHHMQLHTIGEKTFCALHGFDLMAIADDLAARSPHTP